MSEPTVPQSLIDLANSAQVPSELTARATGLNENSEVRQGQVWRAAWEHTSVLVLIVETSASNFTVAPLTIDPSAEDEECLVLDSAATVFGVEVTVWVGLISELPVRVLDTALDQLPSTLIDFILDFSHSGAIDPPPLVRVGRATESAFDSANEVRADIVDDMQELRDSPTLPVETGEPNPPLTDILGKGFKVSKLVADLQPFGLDQSAVMDLMRGKRPVNLEQAEAVAQSTGTSTETVLRSVQALPDGFVSEVERPHWRSIWRERARKDQVDETTARLRASYEFFAKAARQTGAAAPDWTARLAQFRSDEQRQGE